MARTERYKNKAPNVTDEQWGRFVRQAPGTYLDLRVRPRVRLGDPLPYNIVYSHTARTTSWGTFQAKLDATLTFSDYPASTLQNVSELQTAFGGTGGEPLAISASALPASIQPGIHRLKVSGFLHVYEDWNGIAASLQSVPVELSDNVTLLPSTQSSARAVPNPGMLDTIRRGMTVRSLHDLRGHKLCNVVDVYSAPVALSFSAYVSVRGEEYKVGAGAIAAGGGRGLCEMDWDPV